MERREQGFLHGSTSSAVQRKSLPQSYHGESEGEGMRTGRRRFRRSWRQTQSENGAAVVELGAGGLSGSVRWRELPLGLLLR
jgi:hypothetical protein